MAEANVRRRGMGSPERQGHLALRRLKTCGHFQRAAVPIADAIGLPDFGGSEGLPVPREPAYVDKRSQDGEAQATSE